MKFTSKILVSLLAVVAINVSAAPSTCPSHFVNGQAPDIINANMQKQTAEVCYSGYATKNSGLTRSPLYSAEFLTKARVDEAKTLPREDSFHEEPNLPPSQTATLKDYVRSGYDRGHMAPNKDMANKEMQHESFSLANIVPQNPDNNRNLHASIENATRNLARKYGEVYVLTGPAYMSNEIGFLNNRVAVPTNIWKAIYIPSINSAAVYWEKNQPGFDYEVISVNELKNRIGIDVFPAVLPSTKAKAGELPQPVTGFKD